MGLCDLRAPARQPSECSPRLGYLIAGLQFEPQFRADAQRLFESDGRIRGNGLLALDDLVNNLDGPADPPGESCLGDAALG